MIEPLFAETSLSPFNRIIVILVALVFLVMVTSIMSPVSSALFLMIFFVISSEIPPPFVLLHRFGVISPPILPMRKYSFPPERKKSRGFGSVELFSRGYSNILGRAASDTTRARLSRLVRPAQSVGKVSSGKKISKLIIFCDMK